MGRHRQLLKLIGDIHETALDPTVWPATLAGLSDHLDGAFVTIVPLACPASVMVSPGLESAMAAYESHWWRQDLINEVALGQADPLGVVCDWELISPDRMAASAFYQDFRRLFGLGHYIGYCGDIGGGERYSIGVQLPLGRDGVSAGALTAKIVEVGRHVGQALAIRARLEHAITEQPYLVPALSRLADGIVVIDDQNLVTFANPAALDGFRDVIRFAGCRIQAIRTRDQCAFARFLANAARHEHSHPTLSRLVLRRDIGAPAVLHAVSLSKPSGVSGKSHRRHVMIVLIDPRADVTRGPAALLEALGLTSGEARIAALVGSGQSPRSVAETLELTEGTVRTRLKHIFPKLGISRQGELVHLVTRMTRNPTECGFRRSRPGIPRGSRPPIPI